MSIAHVGGIDHPVLLVKDLDKAADAWCRLGFTVSPRGSHSEYLGTANHTIVLRREYVELIGVISANEHNAMTRAFLERRGEGCDRLALTTTDAAAGLTALRDRGIAGTGPTCFERARARPNGTIATARFKGFRWPEDEAPGDLRLRACQHLTPELVWEPALMRHRNTAIRLLRLEFVARTPEAAAMHLGHLLDATPTPDVDGAWRVPSGEDRADFIFLAKDALGRRHPTLPVESLPEEAAVSLAFEVIDLDAAAASIEVACELYDGCIEVTAEFASGLHVTFETAQLNRRREPIRLGVPPRRS